MDFVEYSSRRFNIFELIFQHFTVKELLKLSEINSFYYTSIATSEKLAGKIKFVITKAKFDENLITSQEFSLLRNSLRKYQNLEITCCRFFTRDLLQEIENFLSSPHNEWKNVSLMSTSFPSTSDVQKILKTVEGKAENLIIVDLSAASREGGKQTLNFPGLKFLKLQNLDRNIFEECFLNCKNLFEIQLLEGYYSLGSKGTETLLNILQNNKSLKRLRLSSNIFNQIFYKDITQRLSFRLKSFSLVNGSSETSFNDKVRLNFFYFLLSQMEHLEEIELTWMGAEILKLFYLMPKLTSIDLKKVHYDKTNIPWESLNLKPSLSIKSLDYEDISSSEIVFETLMNATPELKSLRIHSLNRKMMNYLVVQGRKLNKLSVECLLGRKYFDKRVSPLVRELHVGLSIK